MSIPLEQAVPEALKTLLINNLSALNTLIANDTLLHQLPTPIGVVPTKAILVGDQISVWNVADTRIMICISPGDYRTGGVDSVSRDWVDASETGGYKVDVMTAIYAYLHPQVFRVDDADKQAQMRLRAQVLVGGWLRQTCNDWLLGQELKLASTEYINTNITQVEPAQLVYGQPYDHAGEPLTDHLTMCRATSVMRAVYPLGPAQDTLCYGVHVMHMGTIQ